MKYSPSYDYMSILNLRWNYKDRNRRKYNPIMGKINPFLRNYLHNNKYLSLVILRENYPFVNFI